MVKDTIIFFKTILKIFWRNCLWKPIVQSFGNIENLLEELPLETYLSIMWQQDGAPPHTIQAGTITWAPNSTELLHFGSFFWGHLKNEAFQQGNCSEVGLQIKADYF